MNEFDKDTSGGSPSDRRRPRTVGLEQDWLPTDAYAWYLAAIRE